MESLVNKGKIKVKELTISSIKNQIQKVENFIDDIFDEYKIKNEFYGKVSISLSEAIKNAIVHGNKSDSSKDVKIRCEFIKNDLKFYVIDGGQGFDFMNYNKNNISLEDNNDIESQGIFLMKFLSDKIEFEKEGSVVCLYFYVS